MSHGFRAMLVRAAASMSGRKGFVSLMVAVLFVKILISILLPPSKDIVDSVYITTIIGEPDVLSGPWIFLYAKTIALWQWTTGSSLPTQWTYSIFAMPANFRLLLLMLRLPSIGCDLGIGLGLRFAVMRTKSSAELGRLTCLLWFLNPYTVYAGDLLAVPDIAAALLTVLAFLLLVRRKTSLSGLALGASIALKLYPILLLPQFLLYAGGTRRSSRVTMVILGIMGLAGYVYWAVVIGFKYLSITLIEYTPITTPVETIINFFSGFLISITTVALILVYFVTWTYAKGKNIMLSNLLLPVLLVYYTFADLYPQYILWALPFLTLDIATGRRRNILLLISLLVLIVVWEILPASSPNVILQLSVPVVRNALAITTLVYAFEIGREMIRPAKE